MNIFKPNQSRKRDDDDPRILVVDDDSDLTLIVQRAAALASRDLSVDLAHTSEEAKKMLRERTYRFVLLDHFLDGDARGADLIGLVQKTQPSATITLMSSMEVKELADLTRKKRSVQILPKPFSPVALRVMLHEALGLKGSCSAHVAPLY